MIEFNFFPRSASLSVAEIIALTGAEPCEGTDLARQVTNIAPIDQAGAGDLSFVSENKFIASLKSTQAAAVLTSERYAPQAPKGVAMLRIRKPYEAFVTVARRSIAARCDRLGVRHARHFAEPRWCIPRRKSAADVTIDPFAVIGPSAKIGAGSLIAAHAMIGERVQIGTIAPSAPAARVTHAHVGDRVIIHPGCHIGQDGYGYVMSGRGIRRFRRSGASSFTTTSRSDRAPRSTAAESATPSSAKEPRSIISARSVTTASIGRHCIIVAQSGLSGSVTMEDFVVLGPRTGIIPHITVGKGAMLLSRSTVYDNVPAAQFWGGFPAQPKRQWMREVLALRNLAGAVAEPRNSRVAGCPARLSENCRIFYLASPKNRQSAAMTQENHDQNQTETETPPRPARSSFR